MNSVAPIKATFDYSLLTEDFQGELIAAADRIKSRVRQQTADIIAIGHDLLTIKSEMEHGLFLKWIAAEFQWSARTAQNYMAAAEWAGDKYETVSFLPPTLVYKLADKSTPDELKAEVRADLDAGKPMDVTALRDKIEDARWRRRLSEEQERKNPRKKKVSETTRRRREQEEAKRLEDIERREAETKAAAVEIVAMLRKLPKPDFERLRELFGIASFWQVQELLNREQP